MVRKHYINLLQQRHTLCALLCWWCLAQFGTGDGFALIFSGHDCMPVSSFCHAKFHGHWLHVNVAYLPTQCKPFLLFQALYKFKVENCFLVCNNTYSWQCMKVITGFVLTTLHILYFSWITCCLYGWGRFFLIIHGWDKILPNTPKGSYSTS